MEVLVEALAEVLAEVFDRLSEVLVKVFSRRPMHIKWIDIGAHIVMTHHYASTKKALVYGAS
jgi:hypothetical protein